MKKQNNIKPPPNMKGFGFGDAIFAIKDLTGDYGSLDNNPNNPPAYIKPLSQPKKQNKTQIKKPPQNNQIIIPKNTNNPTQFKVNPGKEFYTSSKVQLKELHFIPVSKNVYELSKSNKQSTNQYFVFCQGVPGNLIVPDAIVDLNFSCEDLKQGSLGNCYFISALGSIAHLPQIMKERIPQFQNINVAKDKVFHVTLFESGKFVKMMVDNVFQKLYSKPIGNNIITMILQKAYAQLYGNFDVINIGHSCDAMRDLTGAPSIYIDLKSPSLQKQINDAFQNKWGLVIATKKAVKSEMVSSMHSYNILSHQTIGGKLYLKIRDPRGWTKADFPIPGKLQAEKAIIKQNGCFWIGMNDLRDNFEVITVCQANPHYSYIFKTYYQKQLGNTPAALMFNIKMPFKGTISIHQKHKKYFDEKYSYQIIRLVLAKVEIQEDKLSIIDIISAEFNSKQVCSFDCLLQPATYIIIGDIGSKNKAYKNPQKFTISVYGNHGQIKFRECENIKVSDYVTHYIRNNRKKFNECITQKKLQRYYGTFLGYVCIYYENNGEKHVIQEIDYDSDNVTIMEKKIQLKPLQKYLIMNPIGPSNNCSHKCNIRTKTFYK